MQATIYHNPRCSKSRETLNLLVEHGVQPRVVSYLENPPDVATLRRLARQLGLRARDLLRTNETIYRERGMDAADLSDEEIFAAMHAHPALTQRPIVVVGDKARIGRPPEAVLELLD